MVFKLIDGNTSSEYVLFNTVNLLDEGLHIKLNTDLQTLATALCQILPQVGIATRGS